MAELRRYGAGQEAFLSRVKGSLAAVQESVKQKSVKKEGAPPRPAPAGTPRLSSAELANRMAAELAAVGGKVHRVGTLTEARERIGQILSEARARRIVRGNTPLLSELAIDELLRQGGVEVVVCDLREGISREALREAELAADAGLTSVDYGIAETGTLAILARSGQGRALSLLPPVHVALLRRRDIVYDLGAVFGRLAALGVDPASALTLITGPSRSADIELVLTVGVHGPGELHLVLLDD